MNLPISASCEIWRFYFRPTCLLHVWFLGQSWVGLGNWSLKDRSLGHGWHHNLWAGLGAGALGSETAGVLACVLASVFTWVFAWATGAVVWTTFCWVPLDDTLGIGTWTTITLGSGETI